MWLLNFLPDSFVLWLAHAAIIIAVGSFIAGQVLSMYKIFLIPAAFVLGFFGIFVEGKYYAMAEYTAKIEEMQKQVDLASEQSAKINTVIQTRVVEKIKYVKETSNANIQIVEKIVTKYDNICTLSNAAIVLHDSAAKNVVAPSTGGSVEGTSNVKASELITTTTENYGTYYQIREQLIGWQQWYKQQKKIYEDVK